MCVGEQLKHVSVLVSIRAVSIACLLFLYFVASVTAFPLRANIIHFPLNNMQWFESLINKYFARCPDLDMKTPP